MRSLSKNAVIPTIVFALTACAGLESAPQPAVTDPFAIPATWSTEADANTVQPWWRDIDDPRLHVLINTAVGENFDLQAAGARVAAARAQMRITGADLYPQINVALNGTRAKRGGDVLGGGDDPSNRFDLTTGVSWEGDLWGRLRASTRAAVAEFKAAESDFAAARLALAANVARTWFDLTEAGQQVDLAERTLASFESSLATIEQQFTRGISEALDVRLARGNVATARANLYARRRTRDATRRALEVLLGKYPSANLEISKSLPEVGTLIPVGLPSALVARRPDVGAAQWRLAASQARVAAADRARFPRFTLTASAGTSSDHLRNLLDWDQLVWSVVTGLTQPLFQGFRIKANVLLSKANNREAVARFAATLLNAFSEVETALSAEQFLLQQEAALRDSVMESRQAVELAEQQYRQGLVGIVTLLEAQRRTFNAESSLLQVVNARLQNRINLHLALGGDFALT